MKMRSVLTATLACLATLALSACQGKIRPIGQDPAIKVATLSDLPRPDPSDRLLDHTVYLIGAFDTIEVDVFGVPELKRSVSVDSSGQFSFPLVGEIQAAGRTPRQIADDLSQRLKTFVKDPQVTVNVTAMVSQNLTVDGQVVKPGQFPIIGRQTLMRAIAIAGGTDEYARLDDVIIFRKVQGQQYVGLYNLGAIRRGNYTDPEVFANDIIIVGDSPERRRMKDILAALPALLSPLIFVTQVAR